MAQPPRVLYHGSVTPGIETLEPRKRYTPQGADMVAVYASSLPAFAAAHAFPWSSDEGFDTRVRGRRVTLVAPRAEAHRLNVPVSIYEVAAERFTQTAEELSGYTFHADEAVPVLRVVSYPSVTAAVEALGGAIELVDPVPR